MKAVAWEIREILHDPKFRVMIVSWLIASLVWGAVYILSPAINFKVAWLPGYVASLVLLHIILRHRFAKRK